MTGSGEPPLVLAAETFVRDSTDSRTLRDGVLLRDEADFPGDAAGVDLGVFFVLFAFPGVDLGVAPLELLPAPAATMV